ncbi:MAG: ExbD/TolR family protein [Chlorobium sp.]|nr:ExbD/TolR family protein [Chlorobium sp.]MCW8814450.1 ExbD/TolR family protein [Chlorobium sp.]
MNSADGRGRARGGSRLLSEINVTPFVDVMLVLLIIFMVTAPMMVHGVKVEAPETSHEQMDVEPQALIVSVDEKRQVFINAYQLAPEELAESLPEIIDINTVKEVYLKADKSLSYGFVMFIMAQIREAGVEKIGMVTEPGVLPAKDANNLDENE